MNRRSPSFKLPPAVHAFLKTLQPVLSLLPPSLSSPVRQLAVVAAAASLSLLLLVAVSLFLLASDPRSPLEREDWASPRNRQCLRPRQWPHPMCSSREMLVWHVPQFQLRKVEAWEARHGGILPSSAVSEPLKQISVRVLKNETRAARWAARVPPAADGLLHVLVDQFPCATHGCCALHWRLRPNSSDLLLLVRHFVAFQFAALVHTPVEPAFVLDAGGIGMAAHAFALLYPSAVILRVEPHPGLFAAGLLNTLHLPNVVHLPLALWTNVTRLRLCPAPFTPAHPLVSGDSDDPSVSGVLPQGSGATSSAASAAGNRAASGAASAAAANASSSRASAAVPQMGFVVREGADPCSSSSGSLWGSLPATSLLSGAQAAMLGAAAAGAASAKGAAAAALQRSRIGGSGSDRLPSAAGWPVQGSTLPLLMQAFGVPRFDVVKLAVQGAERRLLRHEATLKVLREAQAVLVQREGAGAEQGRALERAFGRKGFRRLVDRDTILMLQRDLFMC